MTSKALGCTKEMGVGARILGHFGQRFVVIIVYFIYKGHGNTINVMA